VTEIVTGEVLRKRKSNRPDPESAGPHIGPTADFPNVYACLVADLMMQFWTYFWRFRQCQLNLMPFASALHAAVPFSRAILSALDNFAARAGVGMENCYQVVWFSPFAFHWTAALCSKG
jgi:hypothetical protein